MQISDELPWVETEVEAETGLGDKLNLNKYGLS